MDDDGIRGKNNRIAILGLEPITFPCGPHRPKTPFLAKDLFRVSSKGAMTGGYKSRINPHGFVMFLNEHSGDSRYTDV